MRTISARNGRRRPGEAGERRPSPWRAAAPVAALTALLLALAAGAARAEATAVAGFGLVGPEEGERRSAVFDLEYRFSPRRFGIGPVIGAWATSDGDAYLRAGISRDFPFASGWNANVTLAGGAYQRGHGKDLGRGFEFRSAIEVSYHVRPGVRFGAALAHLSNAGISESNPGVETLTLNVAFIPSRMPARR